MTWKQIHNYLRWWICGLRWCVFVSLCIVSLLAADSRGQVTFGGLPLPGATVTAVQDGKKFVAITDQQGFYSFTGLSAGTWTIEVEMLCFAPLKREVNITPDTPLLTWEMKLLPLNEIQAATGSPPPMASPPSVPQPAPQPTESNPASESEKPPAANASPGAGDFDQNAAANGFLINGSVNNGAASPFAQLAAFGNNRRSGRGLYNGGLGLLVDNSALDARAFSLTGQDTPKPAYNRLTGVATLGGPLRIPHLLKNGPNFFVGYQWTRNRNATTQPGLMPTLPERSGDFSQAQNAILDPATGLPFAGNVIPQNRISPQARALLNLYPLPNFEGSARYNYQIPIVGAVHQDALQSRLSKGLGQRDQLFGSFAFQSMRSDTPNLFDFLDTTDTLGIVAHANWSHRFGQRVFMNSGYQFSRFSSGTVPYFANRQNLSGEAGITGNNQDPRNWGPPSLTFSSGIAGLSDAQSSSDHNQTSGVSDSILWNRGRHNITFGGDFRRQQFNYLSQQDPRGSFTFTGGASGSDFADFMLGIPDTSSIAFGNADKYFRSSMYDAYITDDWRISPEFTLNAGMRWEYGSPITELYGRLVNLDIASGFTAVASVLASDPRGSLTGQQYPDSLIHPDKRGFQPRVGIAWRPISGSSLVVRAGYGVYYNSSVYQTIATQMAQQSPLSKSLSVQNSATDPLTLANGFNAASATPNTYAVDPNFRVGYTQNWQLSVQRDLPGSLQMTATYLGIKGTRGLQEFLPNTFPAGAINPCPGCPAGYVYLASNGNSTREAGQIQLRRRLHSGFTAMAEYTFSKSIDNAAALGGAGGFSPTQSSSNSGAGGSGTGGVIMSSAPAGASQQPATIAQNWLNLSAERGLSNFDQRHLASVLVQYTTGMGLAGGTLLSGWKGALLKDWTFATQITAGSGLPLTPIYLTPVTGTGVTGTIRPEYTGASLYAAPSGLFLNPAAYAAPPAGQWGNAGRNSIIGPAEFSLNASMGRTFRLSDRLNLDLRVDATNALNHVTFPSWDTTVSSAHFGLPMTANSMRSMQTVLRLRF
ncbi:MAG TPA: carboxypeptidase regulatory-like domain-containing protein [Bryobacteraceae bacterium]|nr:carboxypeptidase regulatory-like domain-containing protein [Bryobacteraceae bacterium]